MSGRNEVEMLLEKLSAWNAAQSMVEKLVSLGVPREEVKAAIDELTKHAEDMAKLALGQREAARLIKNAECAKHRPFPE
jgi:hypothetical protein